MQYNAIQHLIRNKTQHGIQYNTKIQYNTTTKCVQNKPKPYNTKQHHKHQDNTINYTIYLLRRNKIQYRMH